MDRAVVSSVRTKIAWRLASFFLLVTIAASIPAPANADSWAPPSVKVFLSANENSRVTITPRDLDSQLEYFRDKIKERDDPGLPKNAKNRKSTAIVEFKSESGGWSFGWQVDLVNEISPVSAILSDDGKQLVTFDNWHSVGYGPSTIVHYDQRDGLKRQFDLSAFLPSYYIEALPRSVSSRSWKQGDATIKGDILHFDVLVPSREARIDRKKRKTVSFQIDLNSGHVSKADTMLWIDALLSALAVQKDQRDFEARRITAAIEPLVAKAEMSEGDWQSYLREASLRLWNDISATKYLRPLEHPEYQKSVQWIVDEFDDIAEVAEYEDFYISDVAIASFDQENLQQILSGIAEKTKPNDFRWGRLLIAVDKKYWPQFENMFAHTGIKLHLIDPADPIAPSPDRLKMLFNPEPYRDDDFDFLGELE